MTTVLSAYAEALQAVGAKRIVSINPAHTGTDATAQRADGIEVLGVRSLGDGQFVGSTLVPS